METNGPQDHRREKRVRLPYVFKFCQIDPPLPKPAWDAVNPINVSKSGICFYTAQQYTPGVMIELCVVNPVLQEEKIYISKVLRSTPSQRNKLFFETVVLIEEIEKGPGEAFYKIIEEYLQNKNP